MGIWKMSQLKAPPLTDDPVELRKYINYLSNQIAIMFKDLDFTLNGDINFTNVKADGITAKNIKAGSVTAEKIHVDELSAISADLGKITAGEVYGTYISTNETGYPKTEMSNTEKLFRTSYDENNYINYVSNYANAPAIEFVTGTLLRARISTIFADWEVYAPYGITLTSPTVQFQNWSVIYNSDESKTLQDELNELYSRVEALEGP